MKKSCCKNCDLEYECMNEFYFDDDCDQDDVPTVEIQVPQEILEKAKENADID